MSLYQVLGLIAQHDYDRDNLAADLGLARDDPGCEHPIRRSTAAEVRTACQPRAVGSTLYAGTDR